MLRTGPSLNKGRWFDCRKEPLNIQKFACGEKFLYLAERVFNIETEGEDGTWSYPFSRPDDLRMMYILQAPDMKSHLVLALLVGRTKHGCRNACIYS